MADERAGSRHRSVDLADVDEFDLAALAGSFECTARRRRPGKRPALPAQASTSAKAIRRQPPAQAL